MYQTIDAIYEDGIFKPLSTPNLKEHSRVRLTIEKEESVAKRTSGMIVPRQAEIVDEIAIEPALS